VIVPNFGAVGMAFTVSVKVAVAAVHGSPEGLLVVTVIITVFPISFELVLYVKLKGDLVAETGLTVPLPSSFIVTDVALPPKVFPLIVTAVVPHE
jgi:hypothetical protein